MSTRVAALAVLSFGCDVSPLSEIYDAGITAADGSTADAGAPDATAGPFPYRPSNFDPAASGPSGDLIVTGGVCTLDTGAAAFSGPGCASVPSAIDGASGGHVVASIDAMEVRIDGELVIVGNRSAVLAVFGDAEVRGRVFAGASGVAPGPGADGPGCDPAVEGGSEGGQLASGGGGGGFGTDGAIGGGTLANVGGRGGRASGSDAIVPLQGGCDGARGGGGANGGEPGRGGGGVQISSAGAIEVFGRVAAPGSGGGGGTQTGGGGGGGSGGAILLEGARVSIEAGAALAVNGGGGGGGGGLDPGMTGATGSEDGSVPARGAGGGGGVGGDGGAGASQPTAGGEETFGIGGGGGGGGAAGRIRLNGIECVIDPSAVVSPPATACP
jgi:hypothetical protein